MTLPVLVGVQTTEVLYMSGGLVVGKAMIMCRFKCDMPMNQRIRKFILGQHILRRYMTLFFSFYNVDVFTFICVLQKLLSKLFMCL